MWLGDGREHQHFIGINYISSRLTNETMPKQITFELDGHAADARKQTQADLALIANHTTIGSSCEPATSTSWSTGANMHIMAYM